jgi:hypothetical protein
MKGHMKTEFKYYGVPKAIMDKLEGNPFVASEFIKVAKECNMTWTEKQYHVMKKNIDHTSNNIKKIKVWSDIKDLVYIFQEGYNYRFSGRHGVFDYYPTSTNLEFNMKKG